MLEGQESWSDELWSDALAYLTYSSAGQLSLLDTKKMAAWLQASPTFHGASNDQYRSPSSKAAYIMPFHDYPPSMLLSAHRWIRSTRSSAETGARDVPEPTSSQELQDLEHRIHVLEQAVLPLLHDRRDLDDDPQGTRKSSEAA